MYGKLAWPLWRAAPLKAGGEAVVDGFVRLTRPPSKWSWSMAGATGAQSSITNSRSATANLGLGELCPSLGTLVYAALQRRLEHKPSTGSGPWWGSPAALREPGRTGHVR